MVLVLCLWDHERSHSFAWAGFTSLLVIAAGMISGDGGIGAASWINRSLALCTIWVIWFLITASAKTTEALKVRESEARQASESKSAFLANMSHELRTPLNAIVGFSDFLRRDLPELSMAKRAEYAGDIYSSANHLLSLINDILDLARIGAGKTELSEETVSVHGVVTEALHVTDVAAKQKNLCVSVDIDLRMPALRADRRLVKQIILNLLSNAIKFSDENGRIVVSAGASGSELWMAVTDSGIGIPRDAISKIGHPFERAYNATSGAVGGTGLGLALCREYLELHGGSLQITSVEHAGTTVRIAFPDFRIVDLSEPRLTKAVA